MSITAEAIFSVVVIILGALSEIPAFKEWWDGFKYQNWVLAGACVAVAGAFLGACHVGIAVGNCTAPVGWDDVWLAVQAVMAAIGLFTFGRAVTQRGARAVRAWLAR